MKTVRNKSANVCFYGLGVGGRPVEVKPGQEFQIKDDAKLGKWMELVEAPEAKAPEAKTKVKTKNPEAPSDPSGNPEN